MLLRLPGSLISLSDNHAIMASRRCDCAVADWSVCLIVRWRPRARGRTRAFAYRRAVRYERTSVCLPLPHPRTLPLFSHSYLPRATDLIGDRSGRIARSLENQSASRALELDRNLTPAILGAEMKVLSRPRRIFPSTPLPLPPMI